MATTREFRRGEHTVVVRRSGIAGGPDYVLVHGLGMAHGYWDPVAELRSFATSRLPLIEINPGHTALTAERQKMTMAQLMDALEAQRRDVFGYLDSLGDADLGRKAKIPLFKQFMGTDEITLPVYVGAMYDFHWNDHAGQIAKIRKANGLPPA